MNDVVKGVSVSITKFFCQPVNDVISVDSLINRNGDVLAMKFLVFSQCSNQVISPERFANSSSFGSY